ncbi:hypothetical protein KI387_028996, partial [Taxus chinensis]
MELQAGGAGMLPPLSLGAARCVLVGEPQQRPATSFSQAAGVLQREMAIVYAVVTRGTVVLAEFSAVGGNVGVVARWIPFAYLEDIQMIFMKTYGRVALSALAYAMNDEFSK